MAGGRYGLCAGKTAALLYLNALENAIVYKGALRMSRFTLLYFITSAFSNGTHRYGVPVPFHSAGKLCEEINLRHVYRYLFVSKKYTGYITVKSVGGQF